MVVIADDITGAAEIAGIAFESGEQVRLLCGCAKGCDAVAAQETVVIATDTRSMSEADAVAETLHLMSKPSILHPPSSTLHPPSSTLFKKTDSALRGHVVAELTALMEATGYGRAVYLPANPSKGRTIRQGVYYINNVPIHETAFSYDPEFPARTSVLEERFPDAKAKGIIMPDAESEEDIRNVIARYNDGKTLFAGAADLFTALQTHPRPLPVPVPNREGQGGGSSTLILCGSTQSKPLEIGIPVCPMPREVYDGVQSASDWFQSLNENSQFSILNSPPSTLHPQLSTLNFPPSLILTIPYTHRTGKEVAVHLRTVMAEMAKRLVTRHCPDELIIEGGATAWATLQALGWTDFTITAQWAPGVVQMRAANGVLVTLKPGSYPWGTMLSSCKV